jgi:hypothetical protein
VSLWEDVRHLLLLRQVRNRLREASKMGKLGTVKTLAFGLVAAIVTGAVAQITGACPDIISSIPAIAMAGVGSVVTYLMRKPLTSPGTKALLTGAGSVALAAFVQQIDAVCGAGFVGKIPALLTAGLWVSLGLWLKAPHEAKTPDYVTPPILKG